MKGRLIIAATVALYLTMLWVAWVVGTRQAREKTEAMLDYAVNDIRVTIDGAVDAMLDHLAVACVRQFGKAEVHSQKEMEAVARIFDIDELNIVNREGRIVASNDSDSLGVDMNLKDVTRPFSALTNGTVRVISQPFRQNAYSCSRRKYLGVPFPGGDGYIQVGMDESRMATMIPQQLAFLFDARMEDTVCYLCANAGTGRLVSMQLEDDDPQTLDEMGFDLSKAPDADGHLHCDGDAGTCKTFVESFAAGDGFCRSYVFGGHRFLVIEPKSEFFGTRNLIVGLISILLAFVLGGFAILLLRISNDAKHIKAFYAAEAAARAKDMEIAKTIQASALPTPLGQSPYFRLAASMTPARDVGGDFYDFFMLDATHLAFLVADVSGKGITAALYMMTAKTVIKDALLSLRDIADAFSEANRELCRNNTANMFLTAWGGVLDLETGDVSFVNAGHNPPVKIAGQGTGDGKRVEWLADKSGPMLAFMDGVKYKPRLAHLAAGDAIFLYTDGVTEAMDTKGELFGEERLLETMSVVPGKPDVICGTVHAVVDAFAAGAPAADDLTVLAVQYVAKPNRLVRSFPPTQDGIAHASSFLDECLEKFGSWTDRKTVGQSATFHVILDEIASNIVKHSGASGFEVDVEFTEDPAGIKLVFIDDGAPYDPLAHVDPDTKLPAAERPIGGLGIMMVKKMADSISYERTRNRNFLTVFKGCRA